MPEPNVHGETIVYRLFDVGFAIHLDQASALLSSSSPERLRPVRGEARRGFHLMGRRFSRLWADLHTRVADATEMVERVENSLKVTDDVFLARIYAGALELFRGKTWRNGIDRICCSSPLMTPSNGAPYARLPASRIALMRSMR